MRQIVGPSRYVTALAKHDVMWNDARYLTPEPSSFSNSDLSICWIPEPTASYTDFALAAAKAANTGHDVGFRSPSTEAAQSALDGQKWSWQVINAIHRLQ